MTYKIETEVFQGSDKMVKMNILGRAVAKIIVDDVVLVELRDIYIRRTEDGKIFVAYPSQKDKTGKKTDAGKDVYYPYYKMFPGNKELFSKLNERFIEKLGKLSGQAAPAATSAPKAASKPVQKPSMPAPAPASTSSSDMNEFDFS
jgi:DNA-binding cell septation regulator SpoVG